MRRFGSLLWVSVVLATGSAGIALLAPPATATTGDRAGAQLDNRAAPGSDPTALLLVERAERAAYTVPYSGVRYLTTWCPRGTTSAIVEIRHVPGVGTMVLPRSTAADPAGHSLVESTVPRPITAPDTSQPAAAGLVTLNYQVNVAGKESVAGRRAAVVEVRQPGTGTLAARMWLDSATALVLRMDVFDSTGAVVRSGGFIAIKIERPKAIPPLQPKAVEPAGLGQVRSAGWTVPSGFPHAMRLYALQTLTGESGEIVHASYSDGLSTVSVFAQHGRLDVAALSEYTKVHLGGAAVYVYDDSTPRRVMWAADGTVYTILTDAPDETIGSVLAALPRDTGDGGVVARLGRGLYRVGSWFNPFG